MYDIYIKSLYKHILDIPEYKTTNDLITLWRCIKNVSLAYILIHSLTQQLFFGVSLMPL